MPITELALLELSPSTTPTDPVLRSSLLKAKTLMQGYTGHTFYYLQQLEDPSYIYIVGEWDSLSQHMQDFIPSAGNQAILEALKDKLSVTWLQHLDIAHASLPLPTTSAKLEQARLGDGGLIWSIGRHFVSTPSRASFASTFTQNKHHLEAFVTEGVIGGGWRLDSPEPDREEFVLFCPWKSKQQHDAFAASGGFAEYARIMEYMDGAEIKHARLLDI